jgi:hypothetical protein
MRVVYTTYSEIDRDKEKYVNTKGNKQTEIYIYTYTCVYKVVKIDKGIEIQGEIQ